MDKITIFYDGSLYTRRWLWTLIWAKKEIAELGYKIEFVAFQDKIPSKIKKNLLKNKYKIVLIAHHDGIRKLTKEKRLEILNYIKNKCNKLVWLDTSDSTGTCNFEVLPIVDLYLKKQLLNDLSLYEKEIWGARIHSNYFHFNCGVEDKIISKEEMEILNPIYKEKIGLSWNVGIGNIESHGIINNIYNRLLFPNIPINKRLYDFSQPNAARRIDIQFQGSFTSPGVGWQRKRCYDILKERKDIVIPSMIKRGSYKNYFKELCNSKCTLGLFSYGEICYRDFEAFISGSVLIKPNMDHLRTWPNWYVKDKTYISLDWDLSNLESIILDLKNKKLNIVSIANNAQEIYKYYTSQDGKIEFARHFVDSLKLGGKNIE